MAKRTVYISENAATLTVKRGDVAKLKKALVAVFREYNKLKAQQGKFDASISALAAIVIHWTIPRRDLPRTTGR